MMSIREKPDVRLIWQGHATLETLRELIGARVDFELQLPPEYHFSLCRHLHPDAAPGAPDRIDDHGDSDLWQKAASTTGLQPLTDLAPALAAVHAAVHIQSPSPGIVVSFPDQRHG